MSGGLIPGPVSGGASLPTASAAGEALVSTGAGTTYAATPIDEVVIDGLKLALTGEPEGATLISDGAGDLAATSAAVSGLLASDALAGPAGVGIGGLSVSVGPAGTNGPPGGKGWTIAACFYVVSVGGGAVRSLWSCSNGSTRGWALTLTTADVPQATTIGGGTNPTLGSAVTTGWHSMAFSLAADGLTYAWAVDGTGAGSVSIDNSGALPADAADPHELGNWINGFFPATNLELFHLVAIDGVATEAQVEAMTASPSSGRLAIPAALAADVDMDLCIADVPGYLALAGWTTVCRGNGRRVLVTAGAPTVAVR